MIKPNSHLGLRHIALYSTNLSACVTFYTDLLGMKIIWQPDADNIYLTTGEDNFALHRAKQPISAQQQRLDHIGFFLKNKQDVDEWHRYLLENKVEVTHAPKDHRDGTRSFYCKDPDGNSVQLIYYPL